MHSLPFRQTFRLLTVMAASAANEARSQGPQVPRAPQANVVQNIPAEQPPAQPILNANGLEVMCFFILRQRCCRFSCTRVGIFLFVLSLRLPAQCSFSTPSSLLSSFGPFFCFVYLHSLSFTLLQAILSFQAFVLVFSFQALYCSFEFNFLISYFSFCRVGFYFVYFRLEKVYLLLPKSPRCNSLHCSGFFAISISLRFCRYLVRLSYKFLTFCYSQSYKLL